MKSLVAVAAMSLALAACASSPSGPGPVTANANAKAAQCLLGPFMPAGSNQVTRQQMEAGIAAGFARYDLDRDGSLNSSELAQLNNAKRDSCDATSYIDYGGTGRMLPDAYAARFRTAFEQADTNGDNIVTSTEIAQSVRLDTRKKKRVPMPSATQSGGIGSPGGPGGY